jgi:hypothetical protein
MHAKASANNTAEEMKAIVLLEYADASISAIFSCAQFCKFPLTNSDYSNIIK